MSLSSNAPTTGSDSATTFSGPLTQAERVAAAKAAKATRVGADWRPPDELVAQIVAMTRTLFPGDVRTEIDCDPSEPDDPWMNFWVTSDLEYARSRPLRARWHDAIARLGVEDQTRFRLLIARQ
jgi:hypothetical protein